MRRSNREIGLLGRLAVVAAGLMFMSGFQSGSVVGWINGLVGVALVAAASGVVEVAMAIWYRARRRHDANRLRRSVS